MEDHTRSIRYPVETPPEGIETIEIAEGILWFRLPLPMALDHVNIYALREDTGWTLIDAGMNTRAGRTLLGEIMQGPLEGRPVTRVIVTHHHPDHVGLAGWLQSEHGAELWSPRTAWLFARMLVLDTQERPDPRNLTFLRRGGASAEMLARKAEERPFNFADVVAPMPLGYRRIAEGEILKAGGRRWEVRMGNGHAPEHATLWCLDAPIVLGGDQLLPSISPNIGVFATEPDGDPLAEWLASCGRLARFADEDQLVLPGHKVPYTGLPTRLSQLAENHYGALERLVEHLGQPRRATECFGILFKREISEPLFGMALAESVAHLNHLWLAGRATREVDPDGAYLWRST
ncbi:MAG: MBL fold metallo-hydrolase [Rhodobacteraceae bacterium]|nr:MBL fold metallo-hydrolase [Paracoccaceae bacterium]